MGVVGTGKTCLAISKCMRLHLQLGAYVFIHDAGGNVPENLPPEMGGGNTGIIRWETFEACKERLKTDARGLHTFHKQTAGEVIEFAKSVAKASLIAGGGTQGYPVVVYVDEAVVATDMSPNKLSPDLKLALTQRRHDHVGYICSTQLPNQIHVQFLLLSTQLYLFRCPGEYVAKRLRECAVADEVIEAVQELPDHEWEEYQVGRPYAGDPDDEETDETDADSVEEDPAPGEPAPSTPESDEIERDKAKATELL